MFEKDIKQIFWFSKATDGSGLLTNLEPIDSNLSCDVAIELVLKAK